MDVEICHFCGEQFVMAEGDPQDYSCAISMDRECVYSCQREETGCRLQNCPQCGYPTCQEHLQGGQCATCRERA